MLCQQGVELIFLNIHCQNVLSTLIVQLFVLFFNFNFVLFEIFTCQFIFVELFLLTVDLVLKWFKLVLQGFLLVRVVLCVPFKVLILESHFLNNLLCFAKCFHWLLQFRIFRLQLFFQVILQFELYEIFIWNLLFFFLFARMLKLNSNLHFLILITHFLNLWLCLIIQPHFYFVLILNFN
jgi:hypothetical protein